MPRALARDTMLQLALDAEEAMTIVRKDDHVARMYDNEQELLQNAVERHMVMATTHRPWTGDVDRDWSFRSGGYANAATILRFCDYLGHPLPSAPDIEGLYEAALAELLPTDGTVRDGSAAVTITCRRIRSLRAAGQAAESLALAAALDRREFFYGTGAEPRAGDLDFEIGASLLELGQAGQVHAALGELTQTYWESTEARHYSTRHRHSFVLALADRATDHTRRAVTRMTQALDHLTGFRIADIRHDVYELSLTLTLAELSADGSGQAVGLAEQALAIAERVRGRWGVAARARTPLSEAFRRVYGDIALLASRLRGPKAAELGLRVCLAAKQTGLATQMRAEASLLPTQLQGLVDQVLRAERIDQREQGADADAARRLRDEQEERLAELHRQIEKRVNPILAEMTLPTPTSLAALLRAIGDRHALDFTALPDTLGRRTNWFRTLTAPDSVVMFEPFDPGAALTHYVDGRRGRESGDRVDLDLGSPDWHQLGDAVLPGELRRRLAAATLAEPLELVVSAHRELCLLPWAALVIDTAGTRLVCRAVLAQTPVLTCLSDSPPPAVSGPALIRLVSLAEQGVSIESELRAWGLELSEDERVPLSRRTLDGQQLDLPGSPRISALLRDRTDCGLIHITAHGHGHGLDQHLALPEETDTAGRLSAGFALALHWPESTLMVSCQVGAVTNAEDTEPVGLVVAVLTGGGRSVAAAIEKVANLPTGRMAARLVQLVQQSGIRLDHALRLAQLSFMHERVANWALFNAYVR
ncbi:CHAT domain-containing protein [Micromonospora sp. WMMD712]|nr:CHAT domain-containing protein [Micromonospora sp. WMMD712]